MLKKVPKTLWIIMLLGLAIRLGYFFFIQATNPVTIYMPDSWGYIQIAENLYNFGAFSQSPSPDNLYPDSMRTPIYPVLLWLMYVFQINIQWLLVVQVLLNVHCILLIFNITQSLKLSNKIGFIASLLFAFSLPSIFFTNTVMTEPIFQWMILVSVYLMVANKRLAYQKAFLNFGLAFLLRPALLALPILITIGRWLKGKSKKAILISLTIFMLFPLGWIIRNKLTFDKVMISPVLEINLFFHYLPEFLPDTEMEAFLNEKEKTEGDIPLSKWLQITRDYSFKKIKKYPLQAATLSFTNPIKTLSYPIRSYFDFQFKKDFSWKVSSNMIERIQTSHPATKIAMAVQVILSLFTLIGLIFGFSIWKKYWLLWLTAAYFILTSSISVPDPRFRVPAEPFLAILGGIGLNKLFNAISVKKTTS